MGKLLLSFFLSSSSHILQILEGGIQGVEHHRLRRLYIKVFVLFFVRSAGTSIARHQHNQ
jgi:hypothetical protein